jgi:hypothetical protein
MEPAKICVLRNLLGNLEKGFSCYARLSPDRGRETRCKSASWGQKLSAGRNAVSESDLGPFARLMSMAMLLPCCAATSFSERGTTAILASFRSRPVRRKSRRRSSSPGLAPCGIQRIGRELRLWNPENARRSVSEAKALPSGSQIVTRRSKLKCVPFGTETLLCGD